MLRLGERAGKVATRPYIALLREDNVRTGFFEPEQFAAVRARLPEDLRRPWNSPTSPAGV